MRLTLVLIFTLLLTAGLTAQYEAKIFNADYQFEDGVYLSHASWLANTPDLSWEEVDGEMVQLPEDYRVQIAALRNKNGTEFERIYALSLDGFPYICVRHDEQKDFHEFAGLRFRGRYAYFRFLRKETTSKMMYAYNPANGRPFRGAEVEREREVLQEILLHVPTGEQRMLNRQSVYELLDGYADLQRAVALLDPDDQDLRAKLTRAVKLYNEREPLLLPLPPKPE